MQYILESKINPYPFAYTCSHHLKISANSAKLSDKLCLACIAPAEVLLGAPLIASEKHNSTNALNSSN